MQHQCIWEEKCRGPWAAQELLPARWEALGSLDAISSMMEEGDQASVLPAVWSGLCREGTALLSH